MKKPYWYCSFCKAAKFQVPAPAPGNRDAVERCPDCRNHSLVWLEFQHSPRRVATDQPFLKRQNPTLTLTA